LQNGELENSEGAALFLRLVRHYANPKLLMFDEYHLGLGERRSLMQYLRESGAMPVLCQLLLIAFVVLRRLGARMGEPLPASSKPALRRPTETFVTALGNLYARVDDRGAALRLIARAALSRISKHYALGPLQAYDLASELERRGAPVAAAAVQSVVAAANAPDAIEVSVQRIDAALASALDSSSSP
jgi:hypothetical protein